VAALVLGACGDESAPPDARVVAIAVQDSFAISVDDRVLTRVLVSNDTRASIVIPRCRTGAGYPDGGSTTIAAGFQIFRLYDNGDWGAYGNAQVPQCSAAPEPDLATVVHPGEVVEVQTLIVPHESGQYSWIVGYSTDAQSGCCQSVGTKVVTVVVR